MLTLAGRWGHGGTCSPLQNRELRQEDFQEFEASLAYRLRGFGRRHACGAQSIGDLERLAVGPSLARSCPGLSPQGCGAAALGPVAGALGPRASCCLARTPHPFPWKPSPSAPCLGNQCSWVTYLDGCYGDEVDSFMWHKRRAPVCYIEPAGDRVPEPRAHVSVGREGGSDSPSRPPARSRGGAASRWRRSQGFGSEAPRCCDGGTRCRSPKPLQN
ncbi:guanine nucleotide-binding protein G(I)/G(S)/G(O) subunit gamma-7 isoform X1 [Peromyscus californicus insignis]|uniref:guanine nucleotide-binding protein G(I)/G(S)/G(O) subunit gamma-7 isoform X1 n=1 Tax=Peromyscus californicus insignis TaxID=564181 RepID=UPI0022A6E0DC|nr:guanine nucleotide-binding protein G(I)/G(S)/G(O) subunit gamma-7 isoform X1 [Peromyscus californicus insignis]